MNKRQNRGGKEKIKSVKATAIKQPPTKQPSASRLRLPKNKWIKWFLVGIIVLVTFITFSPALKNEFTSWDDPAYVSENTDLAKPIIEGIKYFFGLHYYVANYIPVTMITYALEYHLFGLKPGIYHLTDILIHLLNVMMVFSFIYLLSGKKTEVAAIVSLFFGIHPMHVESVVWIAELKDVLYTFFFIGGLITYYKYIQSSKSKVINYSLTFVLFVISGLSKQSAVIFPIVLLLLDFYTKRKWNKYVWIEKLPFFIVSFILGIITLKAQQGAINESYNIFQRFQFASYSMLNYIVKLFLPIKLSAFYPYPPHVINGHLPYIFYATPFIALLFFYGIYLTFRFSSLIVFGFLLFLVNIVLVLQVLSVGSSIMADRYTYIPYIGLFFILAMGFSKIYNSKERKLSVYKVPAVIVIIILAITFSYFSYARCQIWKNSDTLWIDVYNKFADVPPALNNRGVALYNKGQYKESMESLTRAIELKPDYIDAYINLAICYHAMHDYDNALKNIDIGLKYAPQNTIALNNKGVILFAQSKYKEAVKFYNKTIALKPDYIDVYMNLANCYHALHDYDNALKNLDLKLKYAPGDYEALNDKGIITSEEGKNNEAIEFFKAAIRLNPKYGDAFMNMGNCYLMANDYDNAIINLGKALEFNPNNWGIYERLGMAYQNKGDKVSADAYYAKANELKKQ